MARSRGVVVAVYSLHMGFTFLSYIVCPVFASMAVDIRNHCNSSLGELECVTDSVVSYPELARAIDSSVVMES